MRLALVLDSIPDLGAETNRDGESSSARRAAFFLRKSGASIGRRAVARQAYSRPPRAGALSRSHVYPRLHWKSPNVIGREGRARARARARSKRCALHAGRGHRSIVRRIISGMIKWDHQRVRSVAKTTATGHSRIVRISIGGTASIADESLLIELRSRAEIEILVARFIQHFGFRKRAGRRAAKIRSTLMHAIAARFG